MSEIELKVKVDWSPTTRFTDGPCLEPLACPPGTIPSIIS
jgi:hypothetical protein